VDTWGIGDHWRTSGLAGVLASVVLVTSARGSMMQRTPENQVQQQCSNGGATANDRHKNILWERADVIIGCYVRSDQTDWGNLVVFFNS